MVVLVQTVKLVMMRSIHTQEPSRRRLCNSTSLKLKSKTKSKKQITILTKRSQKSKKILMINSNSLKQEPKKSNVKSQAKSTRSFSRSTTLQSKKLSVRPKRPYEVLVQAVHSLRKRNELASEQEQTLLTYKYHLKMLSARLRLSKLSMVRS